MSTLSLIRHGLAYVRLAILLRLFHASDLTKPHRQKGTTELRRSFTSPTAEWLKDSSTTASTGTEQMGNGSSSTPTTPEKPSPNLSWRDQWSLFLKKKYGIANPEAPSDED